MMTESPVEVIRLDLPRWDTAWEPRRTRSGWKIDPKTGKIVQHRRVWDALKGNARPGHFAVRHKATQEVISAVVWLARQAGLHRIRDATYVKVVLVWSPGNHRKADEDNLWHLLKVCCDALARGRKDLAGLHLVPDDDSRYMLKVPRIERPPTPAGLWLEVAVTRSAAQQNS
jgi:hypothetical protein